MNRNLKNALALGALSLLCAANAADAQTTFFPKDATIDYAISNYAVIGYESGTLLRNLKVPSSPTVNIVSGASVPYLFAFNNSAVNVKGGSVSTLDANDHSVANVSGGDSNYVTAFDNGAVNLSGGSVFYLGVRGNGTVTISGGSIGNNLQASDNGVFNLIGSNLTAPLIVPVDDFGLSEYSLSGVLQDGTTLRDVALYIQSGSRVKVTFNGNVVIGSVPEPGSVAFSVCIVGAGASTLRRRRK